VVEQLTLSSSAILRRTQVQSAPLLIDNAFELPLQTDEASLHEELIEALQREHPDAEPEFLEDAVQDAIDQLMTEPASSDGDSDQDDMDFVFEADETDLNETASAGPIITPPPAPAVDTEAILREARQQAAAILDAAKVEASQVLADADNRAAEIEKAAYDKGYAEGLGGGKTAGEDQAAAMIQQVTAIVDQATQLHDTILHEAEGEMVALCLEIGRKIIQAELRTNPDVVKSVVAAAVEKINGSPRVTIKVHPDQVESVRAHWLQAFGENYREKEWTVEGDLAVYPGGCVLQTKYGSLDANIGAQFAEIQKTFALLLGTQ
jgi:flagellar biosynthesis/type III secretory pathway protein FliH